MSILNTLRTPIPPYTFTPTPQPLKFFLDHVCQHSILYETFLPPKPVKVAPLLVSRDMHPGKESFFFDGGTHPLRSAPRLASLATRRKLLVTRHSSLVPCLVRSAPLPPRSARPRQRRPASRTLAARAHASRVSSPALASLCPPSLRVRSEAQPVCRIT